MTETTFSQCVQTRFNAVIRRYAKREAICPTVALWISTDSDVAIGYRYVRSLGDQSIAVRTLDGAFYIHGAHMGGLQIMLKREHRSCRFFNESDNHRNFVLVPPAECQAPPFALRRHYLNG